MPTVSESFTGTLPVAGFKFYSFNIAASGTANVTLNSVSGAGVPSTVQLGLGIGQPVRPRLRRDDQRDRRHHGRGAAGHRHVRTRIVLCQGLRRGEPVRAPVIFNITIAHP